MTDRRNDPVDALVERVSRDLLQAVGRDPDELQDGEPIWRHPHHIERAESAIAAHRLLTS